MKLLLLPVCLTWALLHTVQSLRCHQCTDSLCNNTASVQCPDQSRACVTSTSVMSSDSKSVTVVSKNCTSLCLTPNIQTVWAVNKGYERDAAAQVCCLMDNCNSETLEAPGNSTNGKECLACDSAADSEAGSCNGTTTCRGVENRCFSANTTMNDLEVTVHGCISRNLCNIPDDFVSAYTDYHYLKCGAPWAVSVSVELLAVVSAAVYRVLL